jgi:formate hydrogenlyase subunit 5
LSSNIDILKVIESKLDGKVQIEPGHLSTGTVTVTDDLHRDVLKAMVEADEKTAITTMTGIDLGANIGVYYHIRTSNAFLTIKAEVPKENPKIKTITDILPGAVFHEMEATDLLGVVFEGHPSPGRLVLPETWPEGVYPLRKDVNANEVKLNPSPPKEAEGAEKQVKIIIGPQHPALLEPEKFTVTVDGETVTGVQPRIGYVHRGVEKACESRTYLQDVYLCERICGICNSIHACAFVENIEAGGSAKSQVPASNNFRA